MNHRAVSLFEVIVAVALLGGLLGAMFAFHDNLMNSRERALEYSNREAAASLVLDRIEEALFTSLVGDGTAGPGVRGDEDSISILHRAVAASVAEQGLSSPQVLGDLQRLEIHFDRSQHNVTGSASPVTLSQRAPRGEQTVIGSVHRIRFRYYDGSAWSESYNSLTTGHLPVAVEVAMWYAPWPGEQPPVDEEEQGSLFTDDSRETFDASLYTFDENSVEQFEDSLQALPRPDRVRIIAIPDAQSTEGESSTSTAFGGSGL